MLKQAKSWVKSIIRPEPKKTVEELKQLAIQEEILRLEALPRYVPTSTNILSHNVTLVDSASFLFIYREIFVNEIYKFISDSERPYIIDCGANIGLSVIYFKQIYPNAEIIAFEPDEKVADVFDLNAKSFLLKDVDLVRRGLWNEETILSFYSEGADAGRIEQKSGIDTSINIKTTSLKPYLLGRQIDFLKIDIEGAETVVLVDCQNLLSNVKNIFVEYHSFQNQPRSLALVLQILQNAGFRIHITAPGLSSPQPFVKRIIYEGMDMQVNIYGFR